MNLHTPIYLDYNATTPIDPRVAEAMQPYLHDGFGNPSSGHAYGQMAHDGVVRARAQVAGLLGCEPDDLVFTGGGSESDNLAIKGVAFALRDRGSHIITTQIEHPAVLETCRYLEARFGYRVTYLPVDSEGRVDPAAVAAAITPQTVLISVMHANNETGVLQPVATIGAMAKAHGVLFHTDAAQSCGKVPVNVNELGVDLLTLVGHKLYAPKGVGALYVRAGTPLDPLVHGGGQERGIRAGTENLPHLVGLGEACAIAADSLPAESARIQGLRDRLQAALVSDGWDVNGHPTERLPNTLNTSRRGIDGTDLLTRLPEIAASTGSACHEGLTEPSPVLAAMGIDRERALGALRLTLGRWTTEAQVDRAAAAITAATARLLPSVSTPAPAR